MDKQTIYNAVKDVFEIYDEGWCDMDPLYFDSYAMNLAKPMLDWLEHMFTEGQPLPAHPVYVTLKQEFLKDRFQSFITACLPIRSMTPKDLTIWDMFQNSEMDEDDCLELLSAYAMTNKPFCDDLMANANQFLNFHKPKTSNNEAEE